MTDEDRVRLRHMADAAQKAVALVAGISLEQYTAADSFPLRFATERSLEIVGEAARHVSRRIQSTASECAVAASNGHAQSYSTRVHDDRRRTRLANSSGARAASLAATRGNIGERVMIPTREYVLEELFKVRATLRSFGVRRIAVFGSVARNTARADSDIDIVVDIPRGQITIEKLLRTPRLP